jgi:hypothetical protein
VCHHIGYLETQYSQLFRHLSTNFCRYTAIWHQTFCYICQIVMFVWQIFAKF